MSTFFNLHTSSRATGETQLFILFWCKNWPEFVKLVKCHFKGTTDAAVVKWSRLLVRKYIIYYGHVAVNATRTHHTPSPPLPPPAYTDWIKVKMATEGQIEYESVLCVKPEVNVYRIPPRASNRAIRWGDGGLPVSFLRRSIRDCGR